MPGAGERVSRRAALASLLRGKVENSNIGGVPGGKPLIALGTRAGDVTVYMALPPPGGHQNDTRYPIAIVGGGYHGLLTSSSTRIPGLVSIADVAPTAVAIAAGKRPTIRSQPVADAPAELTTLDRRLARVDRARLAATFTLVCLALGGGLLGLALGSPFLARAGLLGAPASLAAALIVSGIGVTTPWLVMLLIAVLAGGRRSRRRLVAAPPPTGATCLDRGVARRPRGMAGRQRAGRDRAPPRRRRPLLRDHEPDRSPPDRRSPRREPRRPALATGDRRARARHRRLEPGRRRRRRAVVLAGGLPRPRGPPERNARWTPRGPRSLPRGAVAAGLAIVGLDAATGGSSHVTRAVRRGPGSLLEELGHRIHLSAAGVVANWHAALVFAIAIAALVWLRTSRPSFAVGDALLVGVAVSLLVNDSPTDIAAAGAVSYGVLWAWEAGSCRDAPGGLIRLAPMRRLALVLCPGCAALAACGSGTIVAPTAKTVVGTLPTGGGGNAAEGKKLYTSLGCQGCHTLDGTKSAGPTFKGLYGSQEKLADGTTAKADDTYLLEAITDPDKQIVVGYQRGVMSCRDQARPGLAERREVARRVHQDGQIDSRCRPSRATSRRSRATSTAR